MAKEDKDFGGAEDDTTFAEHGFSPGRRQALIVGSLLVPTIITLHGTPAWAQTDYTMVAYKYGTNAGLCKNPNFDPNASSDDDESEEFVECQSGATNDFRPYGFESEDSQPDSYLPGLK